MFGASLLCTASFAVATAGAPVTVAGTVDCPKADDVRAALADLGLEGASPLGGLHVEVTPQETSVTAVGQDGRPLAHKRLPAHLSCRDRAQAAAVFASTWDAAAGLTSPLVDVEPAVAPALPTASAAATADPPARAPTPTQVLRLGLGVLGVAGVAPDEGGSGYGGSLDAAFRPRPWWGLRGELFGLWPRHVPLGAGQDASFRRLGVAAGVLLRHPWAWAAAQADAGLVLAHTLVQGSRGTSADEATGFMPGLRLAAGLDVPLSEAVRTALELVTVVWARGETVVARDVGDAQRLPRADLMLRLSVSWEKNVGDP